MNKETFQRYIDSGKWVTTAEGAERMSVHRSTFIRRARKAGVDHFMGETIWDGYIWRIAELQSVEGWPNDEIEV